MWTISAAETLVALKLAYASFPARNGNNRDGLDAAGRIYACFSPAEAERSLLQIHSPD
jgi:hypothetical protein